MIDEARINEVCEAYFRWKDLNTFIKSVSSRGINMPDAISEPMACYCLGLEWNRGSEAGDATDPKTGKKIEFKASSNYDKDLSSFGPDTVFDDLIFLRFDLYNNMLHIYDLHMNSVEFGKMKVNSTETVDDQKRERRRPRVRLIENIIEPRGLEPDIIFDIRRMKIVKKK